MVVRTRGGAVLHAIMGFAVRPAEKAAGSIHVTVLEVTRWLGRSELTQSSWWIKRGLIYGVGVEATGGVPIPGMKMKTGIIRGGRLGTDSGVPVEVEKDSVGCVRTRLRLDIETGESARVGLIVGAGLTVETGKNKVSDSRSGGTNPCVQTGSTVPASGQMDTRGRTGPCRCGV